MFNKKIYILIAAGLFTLTATILIQVLGIPLRDVFAVIFIYTLIAVAILSYLLRFALVFLGVYALFRLLQNRFFKPMAV